MVRFLFLKSQSAKTVKSMIANFENFPEGVMKSVHVMIRKKIKCLPPDGGDEYVNKELGKWLKEKEITHKITNQYFPGSNGRAGRLNRLLPDTERKKMAYCGDHCSKSLWADAVSTTCYLWNWTSVRRNAHNLTPHEKFHGNSQICPNSEYLYVGPTYMYE